MPGEQLHKLSYKSNNVETLLQIFYVKFFVIGYVFFFWFSFAIRCKRFVDYFKIGVAKLRLAGQIRLTNAFYSARGALFIIAKQMLERRVLSTEPLRFHGEINLMAKSIIFDSERNDDFFFYFEDHLLFWQYYTT